MAARVYLTFDVQGDRVSLSVWRKTVAGLGRPVLVPIPEWARALSPDVSGLVANLLSTADTDETASDGRPLVEVGEAKLLLHPALIAGLAAHEARHLGLPSATSLALFLDTRGLIHEPDFTLHARWIRPGGAPALVEVSGALMRQDGQWRRIPDPLYSAFISANTLASPTEEPDRFATLARVGACLSGAGSSGDLVSAALSAGGYLGSLQIHYASSFSLKLGSGDAFGFEPVLFGPKESQAAAEGDQLSEDADSLLAPRQQKSFNGRRGFAQPGIKPAYALEDGAYVYLDPLLRPALEVVQKYQRAPEAERRRFASDPRRIIREETGDRLGDAIEQLFVETEQFSERISGVDIWRTPVLPWVKRKPNSWLPERFGLRIDGQEFELEAEEIAPLAERVEAALDAQQPSVQFQGRDLPATPQTLEALSTLASLTSAPTDEPDASTSDDQTEAIQPAEKRFLTVTENFEDAVYARRASARSVIQEVPIPSNVRSTLKPHQVSGFKWLAGAHAVGLPGVLLADDMGLGKTLQVLAFLAHLRANGSKAPALVVAPTGLLSNWEDEIRIHLAGDGLGRLVRAYGSDLRAYRSTTTRDIDRGQSGLEVDAWRDCGLVLTTYETMRDYHFSFARLPFSAIIFDEIQKLKNPASQQARASKTLNGQFMVGMTGTPVENSLQDLWSIMDTISPGLLGSSKAFETAYPEHDTEKLSELNRILREERKAQPPPMLRRMKDDHLPEMPSKTIIREAINMPPEQARRYRLVVQRAMAARSSMSSRDGMLTALHDMRAVSLHPFTTELAAGLTDEDFIAASARLSWTIKILEEVRARGEKALIFLESLDLQERLAAVLYRRFKLRSAPMRINGGVAGQKRQDFVRRFQSSGSGFDVMILSPKAGGIGLTLTAANNVIHLSRWWNPAVEDQSTDRVFRIGQTKPVNVYLPLAVHPDPDLREISFDLKLDGILQRKRSLSRDLLAPGERGESDISELFNAVTGTGNSEESDGIQQPAAESAPSPTKKPIRPTLSVSEAPAYKATPSLNWTRKEFGPGQARDLRDMFAPINGRALRDVLISDPYAIATSESRAALVDVIAHLYEVASPARVRVEYTPPEYLPSAPGSEDDSSQRRQVGQLLASALGTKARCDLIRRRRTFDRDFHDRIIQIAWDDAADGPQTIIFDLGRGVVALRETRFSCRINRNYG